MKKMKGIRGLAALLVIALAIVLLPVQEAKAEICPCCGGAELNYITTHEDLRLEIDEVEVRSCPQCCYNFVSDKKSQQS